ncbi:MAG: hypothetical protein AAFZ67_12115 [Planctomycetota bacterium]
MIVPHDQVVPTRHVFAVTHEIGDDVRGEHIGPVGLAGLPHRLERTIPRLDSCAACGVAERSSEVVVGDLDDGAVGIRLVRTQHAKGRSHDRVHRHHTLGLGLLSPDVQLQASEVHATPG